MDRYGKLRCCFCENAEKIGVLFLYYYIFFPQRSQSYIFSSCCTILTIVMILPSFLCFTKSWAKGRRKAAVDCRRQHKKAAWPPENAARTCKNLPPATFCTSEQQLFPTFCKVQKVGQKNFVTFLRKVCPCRDSTLRVLFRRASRGKRQKRTPFASFFALPIGSFIR